VRTRRKIEIMKLDDSIQFIKGVGPKRAAMFHKLGVHTLEDALLFIPRRYEDRSRIKPIAQAQADALETVQGEIKLAQQVITPKGKKFFEVTVGDGTGIMTAKWFNFHPKYMKTLFPKGQRVILSGLVQFNSYTRYGKEMLHPNYELITSAAEDLIHTGRIVPIYSATEGFNQKTLRAIMKQIVDQHADLLPEILPEDLKQRLGLIPVVQAVRQAHFPDNATPIAQLNQGNSPAHRRLVFEEFFLLELGLARRRYSLHQQPGIAFVPKTGLENKLRQMLAFRLTAAQERVLQEIKQAMQRPHPMNRLLQGDVGSGKTVVALLALAMAVENGCQAAVMVPTEILAEQHYLNLHPLLDKVGVDTLLLKGDLKAGQKRLAYDRISAGIAQVVIGTHAIIQQGVTFANLGLVIIDEQHRVGVMQRANLARKARQGFSPDVLVMTATPIPRSLALTVYGDLELSVIDEMPPGRQPVKTRLLFEKDRPRIYRFINDQIQAGGQAFVVYPLVEESEKVDLLAATEMYTHLQQDVFPQLKLGLLHGRMSGGEKEEIMLRFKNRQIQLLVATTVVEVGIDIPQASVMLIEHAERFGLAQLHQLRGRVGRRGQPAYCVLLAQYGFQIAEADLRLRGPGEFLGTRQSGIPDLKLANILRDAGLLETARKEAFDLLRHDPQLKQPQHQPLKQAVINKWKTKLELLQVG